jgi:transposase-like protein
MRRKWSDSEKARIALMAIREEKTVSEIAQETGAHPAMISKWKRELLDNADSVFRNGKSQTEKELEDEKEELYKQIGKLHAANDFLKKNLKIQGLL